jgi:cardiolipin synthase A/B
MRIGANDVKLVVTPEDRLQALLQLIAAAQSRLKLTYYTFAADAMGRRVIMALTEAAQRGVDITLIIDSFGSGDTPDALFDPLRQAGGDVRYFGARWSMRYLVRNHQKIAVADDRVALIGGYNISADDFAPPQDDGWLDTGVVITGPAAAIAGDYMDQLIALTQSGRVNWRALRSLVRGWHGADGAISFHLGGPGQRLSPWAVAVKRELDRARNLDIVMAYFAPSRGIVRRIARVAKLGGETRIMLPSKSDNGATIGASRTLYGYLLRRGVQIWEYQPCKLHRKIVVADDVSFIGSANFDIRSLYVNVEMMVRIDDAEFSEAVRTIIAETRGEAEAISLELHKARSGVFTRISRWISWLLVAALDYNVSRRINFRS